MLELTTVWFWLVASMFAAWAVLDGFDLGVGVLHRFVARTDVERREVLAAIGPVWDGNEVWLLAAGGSMFLAFPRLLAVGFSGFYLPVIFVVWSLIVRGVSIELRSHVGAPLWRSFFDTTFVLASATVPVLLGAALGNLVRGVPLTADGYFELDLFPTEGRPGVLGAYTLLTGVLVLLTLTAHGANWLVWKTSGEVRRRSVAVRRVLWPVTIACWAVTVVATGSVAGEVLQALPTRPMAWLGLALALGGSGVVLFARDAERAPFFGGVAFIAGLLVTTVACLFPVVLRSAASPELSLTVTGASAGAYSLRTALFWWLPGVVLAGGYFWWVLRHFRGKIEAAKDGEGY